MLYITVRESSNLGYTEFLVGENAASPSSLPNALGDLEDASTIFLKRWTRGDHQRAGDVSAGAMLLFDFIANELLREQVKRKGLGSYSGSLFAGEMAATCGTGVTGASLADQIAVVQAGAGNGRLPTHLGVPKPLALAKLLNKVKHRNPNLMNFRVDNGSHVFLICPENTDGGPEGIYEFVVSEFCGLCRQAASAL